MSKLTGGFAEPWTFGERARDWLLAHSDEFDVVHDNQTLADGILDIQRIGHARSDHYSPPDHARPPRRVSEERVGGGVY